MGHLPTISIKGYVGKGLWVLEWAWQTFFGSIDRYSRDQYNSVKVYFIYLF